MARSRAASADLSFVGEAEATVLGGVAAAHGGGQEDSMLETPLPWEAWETSDTGTDSSDESGCEINVEMFTEMMAFLTDEPPERWWSLPPPNSNMSLSDDDDRPGEPADEPVSRRREGASGGPTAPFEPAYIALDLRHTKITKTTSSSKVSVKPIVRRRKPVPLAAAGWATAAALSPSTPAAASAPMPPKKVGRLWVCEHGICSYSSSRKGVSHP